MEQVACAEFPPQPPLSSFFAPRAMLRSWSTDVAEREPVNKPARTYPRPLRDLLNRCLGEAFAKQGFASTDIVTHWPEIVGAEIAALAEPVKLNWPRGEPEEPEAAILVLRVEGPAAIEIQHLSGVILERVNRFFGWRAVKRIAIRQAPLARRAKAERPAGPSAEDVAGVAKALPTMADEDLRNALARLGASVKQR
jgi:hypothetical protein